MSAGAWIRRQRDRPIAEQERNAAMAAVTVLLASVGVLLMLGQPASDGTYIVYPSSHGWQPAPSTTTKPGAPALKTEAEGVARRFLAGYLAYTYGRTPASQIRGASPSLMRSLLASPPLVPPAAQARHPNVIALQPTVTPDGQFGVHAVVNDGGLIDYTVGLALASHDGRLLVTGLEGAR